MDLDLNITYVLVLALFLLPLAILNGLVIRPFLALFEERHEKLTGALERAEDMLDEAERRAATFAKKIKEATEQGVEARAKIRAEAVAAMQARIAEERARLGEKVEAALSDVAAQRERAMSEVGTEVSRIAEQTAQKLLGRAA